MQVEKDTKIQKSLNIETALLKAMSKRSNFETYADNVNRKRILETTDVLLNDYQKYFKLYNEHEEINFELFFTQFSQQWHNSDLDDETINFYRDYVFPAIEKAKDDEIETSLLGLLQKNTLESIINLAEKDFCVDGMAEILDKYRIKQSEIVKEYDDEIKTIGTMDYTVIDKSKGIKHFLPRMQEALGGMCNGQLVIVAGPNNSGKSAYAISQVAHTFLDLNARGINRKILYFTSEGTAQETGMRICSNIFRDVVKGGFEQCWENREKVLQAFNKKYMDDILGIYEIGETSTAESVITKIKKYNPVFVIIDILDVLAPEEDDKNLKKLYDKFRQISNQYCPILGTSQSKDVEWLDKETGKTKNKKNLTARDLHGSNVGKQGAASEIITIGKDDNNTAIRYINTPKKKRGVPVKITCELLDIYSHYQEFTF